MPDAIYYNDPDTAKNQTMYDLTGAAQQVKDTMVVNRFRQGWSDKIPTVTVTGTAISGGVAESAIVTGGETLIFTLDGGTWPSDITGIGNSAFDGSASGAGSWDTEMALSEPDYTRTSDTVLTLVLPAVAGYSISGDETVTFTIASVVVNGVAWEIDFNLTCSPASFVITNGA